MLKNEEIRQKYPFFKKGRNDFEAEWITCGCIYKVRKREWKDYCDFVDIEYQKVISHSVIRWLSLYPSSAMSNPRPSLGFLCSKSIPHTNNLSLFWQFFIWNFNAGGPQCRFITSVTVAVEVRMLSVHLLKLNLVFWGQSKPFNVRPSVICHSTCGPGQDSDIIFGSVSHLGWT